MRERCHCANQNPRNIICVRSCEWPFSFNGGHHSGEIQVFRFWWLFYILQPWSEIMSNLFDILSFKPKVEGNREAASAQTNPECEPKQSRKWSESHGPPPPSHQQVAPAVGGPSRTDVGGSPVEPPSIPHVHRKLSPRSPRKEPLLDLETLKAFTIPKKKKLKKGKFSCQWHWHWQ